MPSTTHDARAQNCRVKGSRDYAAVAAGSLAMQAHPDFPGVERWYRWGILAEEKPPAQRLISTVNCLGPTEQKHRKRPTGLVRLWKCKWLVHRPCATTFTFVARSPHSSVFTLGIRMCPLSIWHRCSLGPAGPPRLDVFERQSQSEQASVGGELDRGFAEQIMKQAFSISAASLKTGSTPDPLRGLLPDEGSGLKDEAPEKKPRRGRGVRITRAYQRAQSLLRAGASHEASADVRCRCPSALARCTSHRHTESCSAKR